MSADTRPSTPNDGDDDPAWRPSAAVYNRDRDEAVSGIRQGVTKAVEGGTEAVGSAIVLVLLILFSILGDDDDDTEPMNAQKRSAKWDTRAEPIQQRFEENDVDDDDVTDAIEWARSQ